MPAPSFLQVTSSENTQGSFDGLTGFLWGPDVAAKLAEYAHNMEGSLLDNLRRHPEFLGKAFEHGEQAAACACLFFDVY